MSLGGGPASGMSEWAMGLRKLFSKPVTLNLAGVMLKTVLLHRPGHLGNFTRSFLCCALEAFQRSTVVPIAFPAGEGSELISLLTDAVFSDGVMSDEELARFEEKANLVGTESWLWLQFLMINALYTSLD